MPVIFGEIQWELENIVQIKVIDFKRKQGIIPMFLKDIL